MQLLLIIEAAILYIGFGVIHTQQLRMHWLYFQHKTNKHKSLLFVAALLWPALFITYITWRMIEPLTKSRRDDWPESAEDETLKNNKFIKNTGSPEYLKATAKSRRYTSI